MRRMTHDMFEKALEKYPNRFQLTMMAVSRAKELNSGEEQLIKGEDEKKPVVLALEELAHGVIIPGTIEEMKALRVARRIVREKALLAKAEEEEIEDEMTLSTASPGGGSDS
jgi:DNA-directed RNA polymerase omega subunit